MLILLKSYAVQLNEYITIVELIVLCCSILEHLLVKFDIMLHNNFYLLENIIIQHPKTDEQTGDIFFQKNSFQKEIKNGIRSVSTLNQAPKSKRCLLLIVLERSAYHVLDVQ